jgi:hypothetical protein
MTWRLRWRGRTTAAAVLLVAATATASGATAEPGAAEPEGLRVLHAWDASRAAAWTAGDATRLRRLYVPGSSAGAADLRALRAYAARDVRVTNLQTQVFSARLLRRTPTRIRIEVVDRVVGAVSTPARCLALPAERPARRVVDLRLLAGRWRVAAVS